MLHQEMENQDVRSAPTLSCFLLSGRGFDLKKRITSASRVLASSQRHEEEAHVSPPRRKKEKKQRPLLAVKFNLSASRKKQFAHPLAARRFGVKAPRKMSQPHKTRGKRKAKKMLPQRKERKKADRHTWTERGWERGLTPPAP